jgi:hypothetical protein
MIKPAPKRIVAVRLVYRMPYCLEILTERSPKATMQAMYKLPTKVIVRILVCSLGDWTIAAWRTPHAVVYPLIQNSRVKHEATIVQP